MSKMILLLAVGLVALAVPQPTFAGVQVKIHMGFPQVLPPLVEVEPGVRVVQDFNQEIFSVRGYYWTRNEGNWYCARDHRGTWRYVRSNRVPKVLASQRPGDYRNYRHGQRREWPDSKQARRGERHWRVNS